MNDDNNTTELTATERAALAEWCADVRDVYRMYARPIQLDDPRMSDVRHMVGFSSYLSDVELGELYWLRSEVDLPSWPLALPNWAESVWMNHLRYPEVVVTITGKDWGDSVNSRTTCKLVQTISMFVDALNPDSRKKFAPTWTALATPTTLAVIVEDDLTVEQAVTLGEALLHASRELALL